MKSAKINLKMIPLHEIKPYENNVKQHPIKQLKSLEHSVEDFGYLEPIVIDRNNVIVAGHARYEILTTLGYEEADCVYADTLTEKQINAYRILDNEIAKQGTTDIVALNIELQKIPDFDFTPFNLELPKIEVLQEGLCDSDDVPAITVNPKSKPGDIWILGDHRLMCGDSTMVDSVDKLMSGLKPIIMVTDPPYGVNYDPSWRDEYCIGKRGFTDKHANSKGLVENDNQADWQEAYALFPGSIAYVWHNAKFTNMVIDNLINCNFDPVCQIIWAKQHFAFGRGDYHWQHEPCWYAVKKGEKHNWQGDRKQTTLWQIQSLSPIGQHKIEGEDRQEKTGHSTQKPIECMLRPIQNNTQESDYVYDPFGGSGTTLIACEKTNRKCLMMEISPAYCDVIVNRWQKFTGKDAILESTGMKYSEVENG